MQKHIRPLLVLLFATIGIAAFAADTPTESATKDTVTPLKAPALGATDNLSQTPAIATDTKVAAEIEEARRHRASATPVAVEAKPAQVIAEIPNTPAPAGVSENTATLKPELVFEKDVEQGGVKLNVMVYTDFEEKEAFQNYLSDYTRATPEQEAWLQKEHGKAINSRIDELAKEIKRNDIMRVAVALSKKPEQKQVAATAAGAPPSGG